MSENTKTQSLSDSEVEAVVKQEVNHIFAKLKDLGKTPQWGVNEHCGLIKRICLELGFPHDDVESLCKALAFKGIGGNAAQFRQWDFVAEKLPASKKAILGAMDY